MTINWALAAALGKWLFYLNLVILPGWLFLRAVTSNTRANCPRKAGLLFLAIILAAVFACVLLLVQIGEINQRGLSGMLDPVMREILLTTPNGISLYWRLGGLLLWALALVTGIWLSRLRVFLAVAGTLSLAISFAVTGHVASLDWLSQMLVIAHVISVSAWAGSVLLLVLLIRRMPGAGDGAKVPMPWHKLLQRYGQFAVPVLGVMLVSGGYLYLQLLGWTLLPTHPYQWLMLSKLILVAVMLGVAARHKWVLVPALEGASENQRHTVSGDEQLSQTELHRMRKSLQAEALIAVCIFAVVAVMTTWVGPESHHG